MAGLKDIKLRIKSVRNIQQITKAMKMVAAARIRKAEEQLKKARPYSDTLKDVLSQLTAQIESSHPLMECRPVDRTTLIVVTSDKGLCGAYNSNLLKLVWQERSHALKEGSAELVLVGTKGYKYFQRRKLEQVYLETGWKPEFSTAEKLAAFVSDRFITGRADEVVCYYTRAVTAMTQKPVAERILPLVQEQAAVSCVPYEFEPSAEAVLGLLLPRYVTNIIYKVLLDAHLSELGARLKAMTNATDNAEKLAGELTLQFFRMRQEAITKEILEISGGAEALAASE